LYEHHLKAFRSKRTHFLMGGGIYGGEWDGYPSAGLAAVGGFEWAVRDLPLVFSLDWRPMFNLYQALEIDLLDVGVTIRYRFQL
jgi:hypothetical protein